MKYVTLLCIVFALFSCKNESSKDINMLGEYASFGKEITTDGAVSQDDMMATYAKLTPGDTATIKFKSKVNSVCQAKGCWMKLALNPDAEAMVKFKDYDFFVPKDIAESDAIVEGKAYVEEMSVADQQHYAKDAGESEEFIASITAPKMVYNFEAEGVLIK
ncbi:MAG: DUF4920 domain-containing protein [Flavobacteriaceae bacterium]|nr:DUF4920 domain-containing protein [Flavobacteriaceae bacterium]